MTIPILKRRGYVWNTWTWLWAALAGSLLAGCGDPPHQSQTGTRPTVSSAPRHPRPHRSDPAPTPHRTTPDGVPNAAELPPLTFRPRPKTATEPDRRPEPGHRGDLEQFTQSAVLEQRFDRARDRYETEWETFHEAVVRYRAEQEAHREMSRWAGQIAGGIGAMTGGGGGLDAGQPPDVAGYFRAARQFAKQLDEFLPVAADFLAAIPSSHPRRDEVRQAVGEAQQRKSRVDGILGRR